MKIFEMVSRSIVLIVQIFLDVDINVPGGYGKYRFLRGCKSEAKLIEEACSKLKR
jgi:hypothetical protein